MQTMETRSVVPDRKLLARLVLIREEARNMMGGGILDERNNRGLYTLPQAEVCRCATFIFHLNMILTSSGKLPNNILLSLSEFILCL